MNVRGLIRKYGIHPKRGLGQNFLTDVSALERIVSSLDPSPEDKVLEIGPGLGIMTKMMAEKARFIAAIEADGDMVRVLEGEWGALPNVHIIHGDILDANLDKLVGSGGRWLFAGNIPYNITSPLLFHLKKFRHLFSRGVITLQKEVAERIIAPPGGKEYGILSIAMQVISRVEVCFTIPPASFHPEPSVESAVIKMSFEDAPSYGIGDLDFFTKVVRAAFGTRRKMLKNALSQSGMLDASAARIGAAISAAGIPPSARAEELDIKTFVRLADALSDAS